MPHQQRYRVIQWATGNIGTRALRATIEHPDLELVGVWVNSPDKAGKDAGELAGTDPTGVIATTSLQDLLKVDADCVLYMRHGTDMDELCQLLSSGKNVVTTRSDFHHPSGMDPDVRERIERACKRGNSSIFSTGSSPGFSTEVLPIALLSLSRRLDCLTIDEFGDVSKRNSPDLLFDRMGFGAPMGEFDPGRVEHLKADFAMSLAQTADAHGIVIDNWEGFGEFSPADGRIEIAAGVIDDGHVAAQRISIQGVRQGVPVLRFRANWYCSRQIRDTDWNLRESGWRIMVEGDTPLDVNISFPVAPEDFAGYTPGLTAHRPVNAVAAVCEAPPGIRTTADLPQIVARLA